MSWIKAARWFEWAFSVILMVTVVVFVLLPMLSQFSGWALVIGLLLYSFASWVRIRSDLANIK